MINNLLEIIFYYLNIRINWCIKFQKIAELSGNNEEIDDFNKNPQSDPNAKNFGDSFHDESNRDVSIIEDSEQETNKTDTETVLNVKLDPTMDYPTLFKNMTAGFISTAKYFRKTLTNQVNRKCDFIESTLAKYTEKEIQTDLTAQLESLQVVLPIADVDTFKLFDNEITENEKKTKALVSIFLF